MLEADPSAPYRTAARLYADAGWAGVLPLPERKKASPPDGYTGRDGADPSVEQIDTWVNQRGAGNVGLRLPPGTAGIDVDDYDGKDGGTTLRALEAAYGPLPATWVSTSRHDGTSGIRVYRLPEVARLNDKPGPGIEIIQHHHRYIVCWPSIHDKTGDMYYWITPDGEPSGRPPRLDELAELPATWFTGLQAPKRRAVNSLPFGDEPGGRWTPGVTQAFGTAMAEMSGGRHDGALHGVMALRRFDSQGYPGASDALRRLETAFSAAVTADGTRSDREAGAEWRRMLEGADGLIRTTPSTIRPYADLIAERRRDDGRIDVDHPANQGRHSVRDKLPPAEPAEPKWEKPVPLGSIVADLPAFPTDVFPQWMETQIHGVAKEMQVPADLPAMLALAALSTIATGHAKVAVTSSWDEHLNLYLVAAMPPGAGKSPAAKKMLRPVQDYEKELIEKASPLAALYEQEQRIRDKAMRKAEDSGDKVRAAELLMEQETAQRVTIPQLTVDDITPEELGVMLSENDGRAAILSTEGGLFDVMASSRYDAGSSQFEIYLKGFSGDWHKSRRVSRGRTEVDEALITISLVCQPVILEKLAAKPELAGVGLTARFMYSIPPSLVGWRDFMNAPALDPTVSERYRQHMVDLARFLGLHKAPKRLRLTAEAAGLYLRWHQDMEPRRRSQGDLRVVAEWSEKLRSCVVRVAGLLHLADGNDWDDIDVDALRRALRVADYWLEHAKAVHDLWSGHPASTDAQGVLDWLAETKQTTFTARSSYREGPLKNADKAKEALSLLEEHGWLSRLSGEWGRGGKPTPEFAVHPSVPLRDTACHRSGADLCQTCGTPELCHRSGEDSQVDPAEYNESGGDAVIRQSGMSGPKGISELTLSPFRSPQEGTPPATGATGATGSDGGVESDLSPYDPSARPDEF